MPTAMSGMVPLGSTVPPLPELKTTVAVGMRMAKGMVFGGKGCSCYCVTVTKSAPSTVITLCFIIH
jgi:hypothetical protein